MAQVIIRNLDDEVVATLKRLAEAENTSLEQKLRSILSETAHKATDDFWKLAEQMREMTRGAPLDSTEIIRQARDER